ncbi:MAG TPA: bifunctional phosphopantothenoylcysteine decarboxylase/phosphopantothenate--cysteine ligase CoaBC [Ruminococcaceae bacterium]|nr:bifunctional phosphopantothenoylcysteine decarboxylase/phosphopantothenate--cysteine ligase CoaBC [Oscillospiraceae bacterium]
MLTGKTVVLGVTGSISAYKIPNLASALVKLNANVEVIMTKNAENFITATAFETLTKNRCLTETFDRADVSEVKHIAVAQRADIILVAPASANIIAKAAHGIADDMLSTTLLAAKCPVMFAPAMNVNMFTHPAVQDNLKILENRGATVIQPDSGHLACGDTGAGKLPPEKTLLDYILKEIAAKKDMAGKKVLVTAGPTRESLDPVRFITNHSTGKMGYAVARQAMLRGADVTLISGPVDIAPPPFVKFVPVQSAQELFEAVKNSFEETDCVVMTAAVADYTPAETKREKIKKSDDGSDLTLSLKRTTDILQWLGSNKRKGQLVCGFSMETENVLENSRKKLLKKNADMIAANSIKDEGSGFGTDTNRLTLITGDNVTDLPLLSKESAADRLWDALMKIQ